MFLNVNGNILDSRACPLAGAGLRSGTSLIETMLWQNGAIRYSEAHFSRLQRSAKKLNLPVEGLSEARFLPLIMELIGKNGNVGKCLIRLQVFPNHRYAESHFLIECTCPSWVYAEEVLQERSVGMASGVVKVNDEFSALKTGSRIIYEIAKQQAQKLGWYDALLLNQYGRVAESTISNIFWIRGQELFTPPLSEGCVEGILRQQLVHDSASPAREKPLTIESLRHADELFLTNAVRGIQPIHYFEGKKYATSLTHSLRQSLEEKG